VKRTILAALVALLTLGSWGASPASAEDPITHRVTMTQGQTRTITLNPPPDRYQCESELEDRIGSYCVQKRYIPRNSTTPSELQTDYWRLRGACNGPYDLAPESTPEYVDENGWVRQTISRNRMGEIVDEPPSIKVKGRQIQIPAVGEPGTFYIPYVLHGTAKEGAYWREYSRLTGTGIRSTTADLDDIECGLAARIQVTVRASSSAIVNELRSHAREAVLGPRSLAPNQLTLPATEDRYNPSNMSRCRVVMVTYTINGHEQRGQMSWCGTLTDERGREVTPAGDLLSTYCAREDVTCR
jgi:hypothetical protein